MPLIKTKTTGEDRFTNGQFDPTLEYGDIVAVLFINQGVNSTVTVDVGGVDVVLPPGTNKGGASFGNAMPAGYCDTTKYPYKFDNAGGAGTQIDKLKIVVTKTVE